MRRDAVIAHAIVRERQRVPPERHDGSDQETGEGETWKGGRNGRVE